MIRFKAVIRKLTSQGTHGITIPKALFDGGMLKEGQTIICEVKEDDLL